MRAFVRSGKAQAAAQMLHQRRRVFRPAVKGHLLVQEGTVACFPQVCAHTGDEPQRVVVEAAPHVQIALFRQRLILVIGAAVRELGGGDVQNALPRPARHQMHEAQQVLAGIPKAHAPAGAAFIIAGAAAHIERHHALVLVPDIDHTVQLFVAGAQRKARQQPIPVRGQRGQRGVNLRVRGIAGQHGAGAAFFHHAGRGPFFPGRVFNISQYKNKAAAFARGQRHVQLMHAHRCPAVGDAARTRAPFHRQRPGRAAVRPQKRIPARVETVGRPVHAEHGIVAAALAVFRFMIDGAALHLHLAGAVVALEVGGIIHCVPQAELHIAEQLQRAGLCPGVVQRQAYHFTCVAQRNEHFLLCLYAVFRTLDDRIAQPVAAAIGIQFRAHGLPARVPYAGAVADIKPVALAVRRGAVVAVARQTQQLCVTVKAVAARRIGNKAEKILAAQIIDPRQRCARCGDHIFPVLVVKVSIAHKVFSSHPCPAARATRFWGACCGPVCEND